MPLSLAELARAGNMGDSIDDALGATYQDTDQLRELLEANKQAKFSHPGVRSLETKCARIEAKLARARSTAAIFERQKTQCGPRACGYRYRQSRWQRAGDGIGDARLETRGGNSELAQPSASIL